MTKAVPMLLVAVVLAAAAGASAASAANAPSRDIAVLKRQVATLTRQVKTLQTQVKTLQTKSNEQEQLDAAILYLDACIATLTADSFSATWTVIDQIATATQGHTYFGPQAAFDDKQSCSTLRIGRQTSPPTVSPFSAVVNLIFGPAAVAPLYRALVPH
jgi:hypothetical protein